MRPWCSAGGSGPGPVCSPERRAERCSWSQREWVLEPEPYPASERPYCVCFPTNKNINYFICCEKSSFKWTQMANMCKCLYSPSHSQTVTDGSYTWCRGHKADGDLSLVPEDFARLLPHNYHPVQISFTFQGNTFKSAAIYFLHRISRHIYQKGGQSWYLPNPWSSRGKASLVQPKQGHYEASHSEKK